MTLSFQSGIEERDFASQATTASLNDQLIPIQSCLLLTQYSSIYLLPQGLKKEEYRDIIAKLEHMKANLSPSINQAGLIISFADGPTRTKHDLVSERFEDLERLVIPVSQEKVIKKTAASFATEKNDEQQQELTLLSSSLTSQNPSSPISDTESDHNSVETQLTHTSLLPETNQVGSPDSAKVLVIQLRWLYDSIAVQHLLPPDDYILLQGPQKPRENRDGSTKRKQDKLDEHIPVEGDTQHHPRTDSSQINPTKRVLLSHETTEELEAIKQRPIPEWVRKHIKYSCQRKQTQPSENEGFLTEIRLIKHKRLLDNTSNEKIRNSYGRAIASIAAYEYPFLHPSEVQRLPNCGDKFGKLFREFQETGSLNEANEMRNDSKLQTLSLLWNIHGVGPQTAGNLYEKGYRTIDGLRYKVWPQLAELFEDDPVEKNRLDHLEDPELDREQQQGLKFYDDFQERIPKEEVENIASTIHRHLIKLTDKQAQVMLVGSYRKGKPTSGDVDIVVSHPEENFTASLVEKLCNSLEAEGWIRAKLKISLAHTHRDQTPIFKGGKSKSGSGFAALDIALLVWQDTSWPTRKQDLALDPDARNPATCRRVDIIVSPWKSVGCAVLGWSGGITFERDLREYAHRELHLKFDSSGVVDRRSGTWIDIERYYDPEMRASSIAEAERRVIKRLGLQCFDPRERLTD